MAQTQNPSQISGFPREKKTRLSNLKEDVQKRNRILRIEAPLGIVGMPGSGRKTLAYRFANMNRGVIQEVPVAYLYTSSFGGTFPENIPFNPYRRFTLRLTAYIIEPPAELPVHEPPFYWGHWNNFCCLVFVFDVRNQASFREVSLKLAAYRQEGYQIPLCLIVGNKCDRRHELPSRPINLEDPEYLNERPVTELTAFMEAEHLGAFYFECSAKSNIDVAPLLLFIKMCALSRDYWIEDIEQR